MVLSAILPDHFQLTDHWLQQQLQELLKQLGTQSPDYGQPGIYQLIRVKLIRLNDYRTYANSQIA